MSHLTRTILLNTKRIRYSKTYNLLQTLEQGRN